MKFSPFNTGILSGHASALNFLRSLILVLLCSGTHLLLQAQEQDFGANAIQHLERLCPDWGLTPADIQDIRISDQYRSKHNNLTHVYLQQYHEGIPVFNAISSVHLNTQGQAVFSNNRFFSNLKSRINTAAPEKDAALALRTVANHLELPVTALPVLPRSSRQMRLEAPRELSRSAIPIELLYIPMPDSSLRLAWQIGIHDPRNDDYQVVFVDAQNGQVLDQFNRTIYCHFGGGHDDHGTACTDHEHTALSLPVPEPVVPAPLPAADQASYLVFPLPVESPIHGNQTLVVNPADNLASPFGWHDTNGIRGPEYTITRGNNVYAFLDRNNDDATDGIYPNGGPELIFDFPFSMQDEPIDQPLAALTQLFYLNNAMHDFAYLYGFDEAAGNFQQNNYSRGGRASDAVFAQAHDGGGTNNANFLTLPDGDPGVMQMYLWTPSNALLLRVDAPSNIAGSLQAGTASFGPLITSKAISGKVVPVVDSLRSNLGCSTFLNAGEVRGNIALISRGTCTFKEKVLRAGQAGAIAVIIANNENLLLTMGGDNTPPAPNIPSLLIRSSDAQRITTEIAIGKTVNATIGFQGTGPALRDASLDNGITAHEYAHGISNRLTSGPSRTDCLFNDESMSEGWSDFFTLVTTVQPGQTGKEARGIGNYSIRQTVSGNGIRRMPYSTDFLINNQVYKDIIGTRPATATTRIPHPVGEIWAATLWDLYWAMSDRYGWSPDLLRGKSGNNQAIQLVMDGMKLQPCNPGFLDGRDAILAADLINNNGANQCLIWEVFARRGLGFSANQGSVQDRNDGIQAFDLPPSCRQTVELIKTSTPVIRAGDTIQVALRINNYKSTPVSAIRIQDQLPHASVFIAGSAKGVESISLTNNVLLMELGALEAGASQVVTYQILSDPALSSRQQFFDNMEGGTSNWQVVAQKGERSWTLSSTSSAPTGRSSWNIVSTSQENDHALVLAFPVDVTGEKPVLRFFHRYNTQNTYDGGVVEISTNGGSVWNTIPDSLIFRESYARPMVNNAFGIARINGFSGAGPAMFQPSYIDLSPFKNRRVQFRFRFATNEDSATRPSPDLSGWFVDNVELMDAVNYASEACVTTAEGDRICAVSSAWGTIVEPGLATSAKELPVAGNYRIFPNPAREVLYVEQLDNATKAIQALALFSADGRKVADLPAAQGATPIHAIPLQGLPQGIYFLHIRSKDAIAVEKIVVY